MNDKILNPIVHLFTSIVVFLSISANTQAIDVRFCTGGVAQLTPVSAKDLNDVLAESKENLSGKQKKLNARIQKEGLTAVSLDPKVVELHERPFQKVITAMGKVMNQEDSGDCWIYATSDAEGRKIRLSKNFIFFYSTIEKVNTYFEDVIALNPDGKASDVFASELKLTDGEAEFRIADGGEYSWMMFLISKYGLVPEELMPNTHVSLDTSELYPILRSVVFQTSARLADKLASFGNPKTLTQEQYNSLQVEKRKGQEEVLKVLTATLNFPPDANKKFRYQINKDKPHEKPRYKFYTPKTFAKEVIKFDPNEYVTFSSTPLPQSNKKEAYIIQNHGSIGISEPGEPTYAQRFINVNSHRLLQLIKKQIDADKPVSIAIDVSKNTDNKSGMISQDGFKTAQVLGLKPIKIDRRSAVNVGLFGPDHAVVIVGYDADKNGNVTRLMIMNSWGTKVGQKGFFSMDVDTAKMQLFEADIHRDLISDYENELSQKPDPVPVESQKKYYGPGS